MTPLITILSLIILGATADGMNHSGWKTAGHILAALEILGLLVTGAFLLTPQNILLYIVAYTLVRFALFSYIWNITAGMPWDYIGVVDPIDILLRKLIGLAKDAPIVGRMKAWHGVLFVRFWILAAGVSIPIKYL